MDRDEKLFCAALLNGVYMIASGLGVEMTDDRMRPLRDFMSRLEKSRKKKQENLMLEIEDVPQIGVSSVFEYWKKTMGHERAILKSDRISVITRGLKFGKEMSPEDPVGACKSAIYGCAIDDWYMGKSEDNKTVYDDLSVIFKNERNFEKFFEAGDRKRRAIEKWEEQSGQPYQ